MGRFLIMSDFFKLFKRELSISMKDFLVLFTFSSFFIISVLIFIFAFGAKFTGIGGIYKPIIWVILIFSITLISENFVYNDFFDGSFKELNSLGYSEELIIFCKAVVMWLMILFATIFLVPIFSIFFDISITESFYLFTNITLATPSLTLISIVSSLFSIQLGRNKIIQFILIFPFYIPIIIFTTTSSNIQIDSNLHDNNFLILIGIFFITLPLSLFISKLIMGELNR